jgi:hypothetical protein
VVTVFSVDTVTQGVSPSGQLTTSAPTGRTTITMQLSQAEKAKLLGAG